MRDEIIGYGKAVGVRRDSVGVLEAPSQHILILILILSFYACLYPFVISDMRSLLYYEI